MNVLRKEKRCVFKLDTGEKIVIPSRMYPLESEPYQIIYSENTEPIEDNKVIEIVDSIDTLYGRCFTNSGRLLKALHDNGYTNAKQFVGWVFAGTDAFPVHHSFVMLDNHILDLSIQLLSSDEKEIRRRAIDENLTEDGIRRVVIDMHKNNASKPNHLKCNIGKCDEMYVYCAAEGTEEDGRNRNGMLRKEYPQHPAFKDVKSGVTKTQAMMINEGLM